MKIVMIGLGYIGLPTAVILTQAGHQVHGVDSHQSKVNHLKKGSFTLKEHGLSEPLNKAIRTKSLTVSQSPEKGEVFMIAVPTPKKADDNTCDLSHVVAAVQSILPVLREGNLVIIESTLAPRSMTDKLIPLLESTGLVAGKTLYVAHCPERVLPGNMLEELRGNSRLIGGATSACRHVISRFYQTFVTGELLPTTPEIAELAKLMENTYRDVNIALANELIKVGNTLGINSLKAMALANKHPRVAIHSPGPGVGGHCLAVDPYFISTAAPQDSLLIQQARAINQSMPSYVVAAVDQLMANAPNRRITVLGLAYKGNTDDLRESPALAIIDELKAKNYLVSVYDPHVSGKESCDTIQAATADSSLMLVVTDHAEFQNLQHVTAKMARKLLVDTKQVVQSFDKDVTRLTLGTIYQSQAY